jgi:hypothetical protein
MRISGSEGQHGSHRKKMEKTSVPAKKPADLVIEVEPDVFLLNGNSNVGTSDPFKIVGSYTSKASALQAAEAMFEKMGQLSLNPTVKSGEKRGTEQATASPKDSTQAPNKKIRRLS